MASEPTRKPVYRVEITRIDRVETISQEWQKQSDDATVKPQFAYADKRSYEDRKIVLFSGASEVMPSLVALARLLEPEKP